MSCKHDQKLLCPCLKGLSWVSGILLITFYILFIYLNDDIHWIEKLQLTVNSIGTIAIPFVIWWLSAKRTGEIKERNQHIETLNCIYGDLYGISNLMVDIANFTTSSLKKANESLAYINSIGDKFSSHMYNYLYSRDLGKFPIADFSLKYSKLNINFISVNDPDLYGYLFQLDKHMIHMQRSIEILRQNMVNNSMQKTNLINAIQLTEEENLKIKDRKDVDILLKRKSISIEKDFIVGYISTVKNSLDIINGVIQNIKKVIPALDKYCDEKYPNEVSLHSEMRMKYFCRILDYKNESELILDAIENLYPNSRNIDNTKKIVTILNQRFMPNPLVDIIYSFAEILDGKFSDAKIILKQHVGKKHSIIATHETLLMMEKIMSDINKKIEEIKLENEKQEFRAILCSAINSIR